MSLSFEDSFKKNMAIAKNETNAIEEINIPEVAMLDENDTSVANTSIMTLDENYGIAAYAGNDGDWHEHTSYQHYSVFSDEDISTINDTKDIVLNKKQLSVTQEVNSQYVPFEMPRYYDGVDLAKSYDISIHYITNGKQHGARRAINVKYNNEKIRFGWLIDNGATVDAGTLKFEIHITGDLVDNKTGNKIKDEKGNYISYIWKSKSDSSLTVLQSICSDDEIVNEVNSNWTQTLITNIVQEVAEQLVNISVKEEVDDAKQAAANAGDYADAAKIYASNAKDAAETAINTIIGNYATKDYVGQEIAKADISSKLTEYAKLSDLGNIVDNDGNTLTVEAYVGKKIEEVDEQIGDLGEDDGGNPITTVVDYVNNKVGNINVSEQLKNYYTKSETDDKIGETLENISLDGYATKDYVDNKTDVLSGRIDANENNITKINSAIQRINQDLESVDKTPNAYYVTTYNEPYTYDGVDYTGENTLVLWKTDEVDTEDSRVYVSSHEIVGGGGIASGNTIIIERVTPSYVTVSSNDEIVIDYIFNGTDASGEDIGIGYATWKIDDKIVINREQIKTSVNIKEGFSTKNLTEYIGVGDQQKVTLSITDDVGTPPQSKTWYVTVVKLELVPNFKNTTDNTTASPINFKFTPYGTIDKTVHFTLDGNPIGTKQSLKSAHGLEDFYTIQAQEHGFHLLEAYMTAEIDGETIESNKIVKDILWYDSSSNIPVIGIEYQNFDDLSIDENIATFTSKQYNSTKIEYTVYDPSTNFPTVTIEVDGNPVDTRTLNNPTDSYTFSTDEIGEHVISIICGEDESKTVKTIKANIEKLDIDVSPITTGLVFDFNPSGYSNSGNNRLWTNGTVSMSVSPNFDWINGGYKTATVKTEDGKEYEESYFLIKSGTRAYFDYKMFDGGVNGNPSVHGSEMKLIFMTENVQNKDAVWFSNVESDTKEVNGVMQATNVGIQLGVHEGWLKTNNASNTDIVGSDGESSIAATNTYLYMPYSEEDIIEMDINIDTLNADKGNAFVMAYEDGVPSKAYVYDGSDRLYQYTPQPITIGSDYCDVRIYRMKAYSNSLGTEDIMKNFIADARNTDEMLSRYNRNSIYYNSSTKTYTPYKRNGVLDPERLASVIPNVKILMLETDHFTTSKKTFVKSNFRCIHASGGDLFEGDPFYDNWLFENGWHSGQGTTSDNYGNSSRNVDFLFNCDGVHKPSDKVEAESNYISQVTLGYGTESAVTEKVTDWKGDSGKVSLTRTSVPNNFFNLKVNVASSENVNNMLLQKRYNDFLPYISPAKKRDSKIKCTMEFVPAILFIRETNPDISTHTEFLDTDWHFYSLGNIGDSKKTDYTRAYDPEDMNEFTIEISDNTKNNSTFQSGVYLDNNGNRHIEKFTIMESEEDGEIILTPVSIDKPQSFVYPITIEEWENEDNMRHWSIYNEGFDGDHSFEARYACCGDYRDGKLVNDTSGRGKEQMKLNEGVWRAFYRWVITSTDKEFVEQLDEWCVRSAVEFFYAFTHMYTMMDNRAKNTFWHFAKTGEYRKVSKPVPELLHIYCELIDGDYVTTSDVSIDSGKTYYTQYAFDMHDYDNDTALGINNNGELIFPYGREDIDYNIDGNPASGYVFNGATSVFWCRLRDLLSGEIKSIFQTATKECFSASDLIKQFDAYQECFPEEIWRLDIERKYIRIFNGESVDNSKPKSDDKYLRDMMQGRKKYQRRQWVRDQEIYFGTMNIMDTVVGDNNRITFRCYTPDSSSVVVKPDYTLRITPYSDMYVSVMFGNGGVQQKRAKAGIEYTIECPLSTMTDTQVVIYGANRIQALNDLSACYIDENNFSNATRLKKLVIGNTTEGYDNPKFVSLSIGNNKLLEELDIRNCHSLTGSLNLASCNNLLKLYAEGTKLTGVTFATNGKIQLAHLPDTINTLIMKNLDDLTDFDATLNQLETLTLQGGAIDSLDIINRCINTLRVLYLYDIDWKIENVELLERIILLFYSVLTGKVYTDKIKERQLEAYNNKWRDLEITYDEDGYIQQIPVTFINEDGSPLFNEDGTPMVQYVDIRSKAVDPSIYDENGKPIFPTTESSTAYDYTFTGNWVTTNGDVFDFNSIIREPITLRATYSQSLRTYKINYVTKTKTIEDSGLYGDNIVYDYDKYGIPEYTKNESEEIFYLFSHWDKSGFLLEGENKTDLENGVKIINAVYDRFDYDVTVNGLIEQNENPEVNGSYTIGNFKGLELSDLSPVHIYALTKLGVDNVQIGQFVDGAYEGLKEGDSYTITVGNDVDYRDIESELFISEKTSFGNSNYNDTGVQLFDEDKDFVLAIDYKFLGKKSGTLVQCLDAEGSNRGFKLWYNGIDIILTYDGVDTTITKANNREMIVLRNAKDKDTDKYVLSVFTSSLDNDSVQVKKFNRTIVTNTNASLIFGASFTYGEYGNFVDADINWAKMWNKDLGDKTCESLAMWTHETIDLNICGFKHYILEDKTKSSFSLLASHLLERKKQWNNGSNSDNDGGWAESDLNKLLNNRLYKAMPLQIRYLLKPMIVHGNDGIGTSVPYYTKVTDSICYITIPSAVELCSSDGNHNYQTELPYSAEVQNGKDDVTTKTISYMTRNENRIRAFRDGTVADYWTRSPEVAYQHYVWKVNTEGVLSRFTGSYPYNENGVLILISF